ncbi:methyltransferase domain-containing protein [Streptomyces sp. NPDC005811]|uniref:SAM-dependent methyltransferase n=1 Tax=Streptomyces sp. NPDC005811 TaxID=3154565 RepID=UPI0033E60D64
MTEQPGARLDAMALYDLQHVRNAPAARPARPGPLTPADLEPYDQLHHLGHRALDHAVARLGAVPGADVVDIGAGLGGPARYLAERYGCRVTAVELQPELHELSTELTALCGLSERVTAVRADALALRGAPWSQRYDHPVSLLTILHIPRRADLFGVLHGLLRPGGTFYREDFYARRPLTDGERAEADLTDVVWTDATGLWLPFVVDRAERFRRELPQHVRLHGEPLATRLLRFYDTVASLFTGGGVGGVRLSGRRD